METAVRLFIIFGAFSGLSEGSGVLPDVLNAAIGGSVSFNTTMTPSETPFAFVTWSFGLNNIGISSPSGETITEEYRGRAHIFHSTGSLELRNLTAADSGEYGVSIIPVTGSAVFGTTTLGVHGLSERAGVLPDVLNAAIGGSVSFNPTMTPSETPFAVVTWSFGLNTIGVSTPSGETITEEYRDRAHIFHSTGSLELRSLTAADSGEYGVSIIPVTGSAVFGTTTLGVHAPVSNVTINPKTVNLVEFIDSLKLSCSSSGSSLTFLWIKDGSEVTASDRVQITDGGKMLTIVNVTRGDQGNYMCEVSNPASSATSNPATVTVYSPVSNVTINPKTVNLVEFIDSLKLSCSSSGSSLTFLWIKDGSEVTASNRVQITDGGKMLTIVNVTRGDQGNYMCEVSNPASSATSDPATVTVYYGPENVQIRGENQIEVGSTINLTCTADSLPSAEFTWLLNETRIFRSSGFTKNNANVSDSGTYTCKATNEITGTSVSAEHKLSVTVFSGESSGCGAGCIAGIVIACIVLVAALVGGGYFIYQRKGNTEAKPKVDVDVDVDEQQENHYENISAIYDKVL